MAEETLLQTFFTRLGFEVVTKGLDEYKDKLVGLSGDLLKMSGIASLSLGGLFAFTQKATSQMADINKMSETYDIATTTIAAFNSAGRQFDITTESMMGGLGTLNRMMGRAAAGIAGGRGITRLLDQYGLHVKDANGHMKDMQTFLGDVAERMTTLSSQEQVNLVTRLGFEPGMVKMLRNGREEFEKIYATAAGGLPFTDEDYKKADEFELAFRNARAAIGVISSEIGLTLMPVFKKAMDSFLRWWHSNGERVMARIKYWVGMLAQWLDDSFSFMARLIGRTNALEVAMKLLGAAVAIIVAAKLLTWIESAATAMKTLALMTSLSTVQFLLIAAAVLLVAGLIILLIDDFETWRKGGISVIGAIVEWWKRGAEGLEQFRAVALKVWNALKGIWEPAVGMFKKWIGSILETFKSWLPVLKIVGIVLVGFLAVALVAVVALAGAFLFLISVLGLVISKMSQFLAKLITKPKEAIRDLTTFLQSIFGKVGDWVGSALTKVTDAIGAWVASLWDKFKEWVAAGVAKVIEAFVDMFHWVVVAIKFLFLGGITDMIDKAIAKVKAVVPFLTHLGGAGEPTAITGGLVGGGAPPTLETKVATPMLGPNVGGQWRNVDTSQNNSNNMTNTFNVNSMKEATDGVKSLQEDARRNQQPAEAAFVH